MSGNPSLKGSARVRSKTVTSSAPLPQTLPTPVQRQMLSGLSARGCWVDGVCLRGAGSKRRMSVMTHDGLETETDACCASIAPVCMYVFFIVHTKYDALDCACDTGEDTIGRSVDLL